MERVVAARRRRQRNVHAVGPEEMQNEGHDRHGLVLFARAKKTKTDTKISTRPGTALIYTVSQPSRLCTFGKSPPSIRKNRERSWDSKFSTTVSMKLSEGIRGLLLSERMWAISEG